MSFDDPTDFSDEREPIPERFHSFETGGPFKICSVCSRAFDEDEPHLIEKAFQKGETVYEYAICQPCHDGIREELSEESRQRIESHLREAIGRAELFDDPLERCIFSGRELGEEHLICGLFVGRWMVPQFPCFAISGEEMEKIAGLLSKSTRERLDQFTDDVLGIPGLTNPVPVLV
ncbi:hypothetical protein [Haloferula sp. A504]|uniref:hypothetical protein n=1 Tax=Haloferula sp. A504 TaxID=3373601 RepID=UPI0031BC9B1F|nr:hypothetical protein [Verrucomicrobiaceae bacterium E54]